MSGFIDYLHEVFEPFGPIRTRRMFGGYGVFHRDVMLGLVADDVLYLKADTVSQPLFLERGLEPFTYRRGRTMATMSYFAAPEEMYEDQTDAKYWVRLAYDAAVRSRIKSPKRRRKT